MVKLTADIIERSPQFMNPAREYELDLRLNKIPAIENLGATLDQFEVIDFSDNEIKRLDGFPLLNRLRTIYLSNNRINKVAADLGESLPHLEEINLTNNNICDLSDIVNLKSVSSLKALSCLKNPVVSKPDYRLFTIHTLPTLTLLDFRKIKQEERQAAKKKFGGAKGKKHKAGVLEAEKAEKLNGSAATTAKPAAAPAKVDAARLAEIERIKQAIANATTLEEVMRLEEQLKAGVVPGNEMPSPAHNGDVEME